MVLFGLLVGEQSEPSVGREWKISVHAHMWYVYIYIYMWPSFITRKNTEDFTDMTGNCCLGKPTIDTLDSSMKKMAADLYAKGKYMVLHSLPG